jgi:2-polyprenyl-3-methyl-5-hydroxy-6-metoxy-1,4-benzoquinol methylase
VVTVIEATGERFIPEMMGGVLIEAEHLVRYALAAHVAKGKRVLDAGCGVGWGGALLRRAGAASVAGVDIAFDAIGYARTKAAGVDFVVADLGRIPFSDGSFEVITCFEAIEHVERQDEVLDELARVLEPGGLLLVSSPNPRVYPPGNPFHVHELTPEELQSKLASRFDHTVLLHQYEQTLSLLARPGDLEVGAPRQMQMGVVGELGAGTDPYSVVVASSVAVPDLPLVGYSAHSTLADLLTERIVMLNRRVEELREVAEGVRYPAREHVEPPRDEEVESLRRDRERLSVRLLESEQVVAELQAQSVEPARSPNDIVEEELRLVVAQLEREYNAVRNSVSWRVTRPLRAVVRRLKPRA